jgi:hypothetical protein
MMTVRVGWLLRWLALVALVAVNLLFALSS